MNRRSFISKALAGLAAIPLVSKLTAAMSPLRFGDFPWPDYTFGGAGEPVQEGWGWHRVLTQKELDQVYNYLARKYGVTLLSSASSSSTKV